MVELLVAMLLSSIVGIAVVQLYGQNKNSYTAHEDVTRLQENGRYAIQLLTKELRSADYWGCAETFDNVTNNVVGFNFPDPTTVGVGVGGTDGLPLGGADGYISQPDTLQITGLRSSVAFPLDQNHDDTTSLNFQARVPGGLTGITPNEILIVSNCERAVLFQVTNDIDGQIDVNAGSQVVVFEHSDIPSGANATTFANADARLANSDFPPYEAAIYRNFTVSTAYSIANVDDDNNPATPAIPTLMRSIDGAAPQPLVPGVENMQVVYGEDTDNDNEANRFVSANVVDDFENVVSVRVSLLVRSPDANNTFASGYTLENVAANIANIQPDALGRFHNRRVYETTIALRNRTL